MEKSNLLRKIGFTEYESRALASLIKKRIATPKELSMYSGVPQNKLYKILAKFTQDGIVALVPSNPKKYQVINIKPYLARQVRKKEEELREIKNITKNIRSFQEIQQADIFSVIIGQKAIMDKIAEQSYAVKKEIIGVQRNWQLWGEGLRAMQRAIKRGVRVKMIGIINQETQERAKEWRILGAKIKGYNEKFGSAPLRFTIFDNKEARITFGKPEIQNPEEYITLWTQSKPFIKLLRNQFMQMWKQSKSF